MRIEFVYSRDLAYFREHVTVRRPWIGYVLAGAAIAVGAGVAVGMDDPNAKLVGLVIGFVGVLWITVVRRSRPSVAGLAEKLAGATAPRRWLLTDDGVESETELTSSRYAWTSSGRFGVAAVVPVRHRPGDPGRHPPRAADT